jgi:hypothetical protein
MLSAVSAELARHLLQTGSIAPEEVHAALLDVVTLGVPFVQALVSRGSGIGERLEGELGRLRVPTLRSVQVSRELAARLPTGMCERLLAVPVGRASTGEVEVACVDPLDPAVGAEFAQKLGAPVKIVRASLSQVLLGIESWLDMRERQRAMAPTPALGTLRAVDPRDGLGRALGRVLGDGPGSEPEEEAPTSSFPLVPRSVPPMRPKTNPGLGNLERSWDDEPPDSSGQPIISLMRPKPVAAPVEAQDVELDLSRLEAVESPDGLVKELVELARPLARLVVVLALRSGVHEARGACPELAAALSRVEVASSPRAVPDLAVLDGHYLGRLPEDDLHRALREAFGDGEVYAAPVLLSGRPSLTLVLGAFESSLETTRSADRLAAAASTALERIVLQKKRGGTGQST